MVVQAAETQGQGLRIGGIGQDAPVEDQLLQLFRQRRERHLEEDHRTLFNNLPLGKVAAREDAPAPERAGIRDVNTG